MKVHFIRACAWLFAVCCAAASFAQVSIEPGTDRMGGDYKGFAVSDPASCQKACETDPACKAFTFVKAGVKGPQAMCFLKSTIPPSTPDSCCTSGARIAGGRPAPRGQAQAPASQTNAAPPRIVLKQVPLQADPEPPMIIGPPSTAEASEELGEHTIRWTWSGKGCFPGAAGSAPKPCPYVKDIDGFKVYRFDGGLIKTLEPQWRDASLGKQSGDKCYVVTAFKGELESAPGPVACTNAPKTPPYKTSSSIPTPANLRATQDPKECAAATGGGFMGPICDAALKSNAQILLWDHPGTGIDGFRVYDSVKQLPFVVDTKPNAKLRMFAVQPTQIALSDYCFTVRAYKGDTESPSSNPVCITPKGPAPVPVKPKVVLAPMSGMYSSGVELLRNQNSGCPFEMKHYDIRNSGPLAPAFTAMWMHIDKNILCGKRTVLWTEASVLFPLDELPENFKKVELRFTAGDTVAKEGTEGGFLGAFGNKPTFGKNCIQSIHAYYDTLVDNTSDPDRLSAPNEYFSWLKEDLITTQTTANTTHRYDITPLVKKSLDKKKKKLGFVWSVNRNMAADNDMCIATYEDVALEVTPKQ